MVQTRFNVETGFEVDTHDYTREAAVTEVETFMDGVATMEADERFPDILDTDVSAEVSDLGGVSLKVRLTIGTINASHAVARAQAFVEAVIETIGGNHFVGAPDGSDDVVFDDFYVNALIDA